MVTIIAGKVDEGKTTKLVNLYESNKLGDGFACVKVMKNNEHIGYNFYRLSTKEEIPFMINAKYKVKDDIYDKEFKKYCYSQKALDKVLLEIKHLIKSKVSPLYLDEVGLLELDNEGNDEAFRLMLRSNLDIVVSIRDKFVPMIIKNYHIKNFKIVGVK